MSASRKPRPSGTVLRATGRDGPQRVASDGARWTDEAEALFLDSLAASCNVRLAARASGFSTAAIYWRRRHHAGFAQRWQAALEQGYARLEAQLLAAANAALDPSLPDPDHPFPAMTVREAITVLQLHRAAVRGDGATRHPGRLARPRPLDEVRDSILRKLDAIEHARTPDPDPEARADARAKD